MHRKIFFLIVLDQITKLIFSNRDFFSPENPSTLGFLSIHPEKNFGLAFNLNFGLIPNIIIVTIGLIFFAHYYYQRRKNFSYLGEFSFVLIFAGAISNIADRIYLGYVRDFFDIGLGFTFNLADSYVLFGLLLFLYLQDGDKYTN